VLPIASILEDKVEEDMNNGSKGGRSSCSDHVSESSVDSDSEQEDVAVAVGSKI
jgi:hypothetical protein